MIIKINLAARITVVRQRDTRQVKVFFEPFETVKKFIRDAYEYKVRAVPFGVIFVKTVRPGLTRP